MRVTQWAFALLCLGLTGCGDHAGKSVDIHTGETLYNSAAYNVSDGLLSLLSARAYYSSAQGYRLETRYMATGLGWMHFSQAWSFGTALPYTVDSQNVVGCGAGCTLSEMGSIALTEEQFQTAAAKGFTFELVGEGEKLSGTVPAGAFQEVLKQMKP